MRRPARAVAIAATAAVLMLVFASTALAHPLGNFTVNHLSVVTVSRDAVAVRYVLDLAEIPTLQETNAGTVGTLADRIADGLEVQLDGRTAALRPAHAEVERVPGQAGLDTLRVTVDLMTGAPRDGARIEFSDRTFPGRVGWHDVVLRGGIADPSVGPDDPTGELRTYPSDPAISPPERTRASARVALSASVGQVGGTGTGVTRFAIDTSADALKDLVRGGTADPAALLAALFVAVILGALHALGPGHGKALVAAYLVGSRGVAREAFILGGTVTVTHTAGVYALGIVTLAATQLFVPEAVYPVLSAGSGVVVTLTGAALLRSRLRRRPERHVDHEHHDHGDAPGQHRHDRVGLRELIALGVSGGLLPCPTALVILLAAVSFHSIVLGMALVAAFSVGLASVLTGLGLAVVWARGLARGNGRALALARSRWAALAARWMPAMSAAAIAVAGVVITAGSLGGLH